jgi:hypothetical protein
MNDDDRPDIHRLFLMLRERGIERMPAEIRQDVAYLARRHAGDKWSALKEAEFLIRQRPLENYWDAVGLF